MHTRTIFGFRRGYLGCSKPHLWSLTSLRKALPLQAENPVAANLKRSFLSSSPRPALQTSNFASSQNYPCMARKKKAKAAQINVDLLPEMPAVVPRRGRRKVTKKVTVKAEGTQGSSQDTMERVALAGDTVLPPAEKLVVKEEVEVKQEGLGLASLEQEGQLKPKKKRNYANAYTRKGEGLAAAIASVTPGSDVSVKVEEVPAGQGPSKRAPKRRRSKAETPAEAIVEIKQEADAAVAEGEASKKKSRKKTTKKGALPERKSEEDLSASNEAKTAEEAAQNVPKRRKRATIDPNAFKIPTEEILEEAVSSRPADRPVPNLGFACLNATLRAQKPPIFTNRDCIKKTWEKFGVEKISQLALDNCTAIGALIHWNHVNGIRFFRMSSKIFPWCTEWEFEQLPDKEEIKKKLAFAGSLARAFDQRLTFHPSHFVKLGCEEGPLLNRSLKELEMHSLILDLMGYEPSHWNKINIHIGGNYGDKVQTMQRFAKNFGRLSPSAKKRLTVENDDQPNSYSITDLMSLHEQTGIPLVFDFHHHRFCPGGLTEEEAFKTAISTWPKGIRPVVHWSESQEGRRPHAHSDFVKGPLRLYGLEKDVDVMIESKAKELALLRLRDPEYRPSAAALAAAITDD